MSRKCLFYFPIAIIMLLLQLNCKNNIIDNKKTSLNKIIKYRHADSSLVIGYFTGKDKIPDSLANFYFKDVLVESLDPINYAILFKKLKPDKVRSIRFYSFDELDSFTVNLSKFNKLEYLHITGNKIKKVKLGINLNSQLRKANFHSPELKFPDFDSSLLQVEEFSYSGNSEEIPNWIENLNSLYIFHFRAKQLKEIACNICKMKSIEYFDISETDLYKKELDYFEKNGKYYLLDKFIKCKPEIEFKIPKPPHGYP